MFYLLIIFLLFFITFWTFVINFTIKIETYYDIDKINEKLNTLHSIHSLENLPKITFKNDLPSDSVVINTCLTTGIYVGPENNEDYDCQKDCNDENVMYKFVEKHQTSKTGIYKKVGGYCVPTDAAICNLNTTFLIKKDNGWFCIAKWPEFGGTAGNKINVCHGKLKDNYMNQTYNFNIPSNLIISNPNEYLPNSNTYRFTCPEKITDENNNYLIESEWSRLELVRNFCSRNIETSVPIEIDIAKGICKCAESNPMLENLNQNKHLPCTSCREGYKNGPPEIAISPYCFNYPVECNNYNLPMQTQMSEALVCPGIKNCINAPLNLNLEEYISYNFGYLSETSAYMHVLLEKNKN